MVDVSEEKMDQAYKKAIAGYLRGRSELDPFLAEALKKPGKTLDGVLAYVKAEARKQAQENVAVIPDDEVFGWAVHYVLEDSLDCEPKRQEPLRKVEPKSAKPMEPPKGKAQSPRKAKSVAEDIQLTLFDF